MGFDRILKLNTPKFVTYFQNVGICAVPCIVSLLFALPILHPTDHSLDREFVLPPTGSLSSIDFCKNMHAFPVDGTQC